LSLIRDTYARFHVLIHEIGKFGIVGIVSTIITFLIQNALYGHTGPTTSVILANAIATCFAYVGNRYWAFKHRKTAKMGRETVLFVFFNVVGTLIQTAFVDTNHYLLHNTGSRSTSPRSSASCSRRCSGCSATGSSCSTT
jgi:putative flippase GtrA